MSKTATANFSIGISGDGIPPGAPSQSGSLVNNPSPAWQGYVATANGFVTLPWAQLPAGFVPTFVAIFPPAGSVIQKTWKGGGAGDTGNRIHPNYPWFMSLDPTSTPAAAGISANGVENLYVVIA